MSGNGTQLKTQWTGERIARLGFLVGLGWDAKSISEDAIIASTTNNVHRQAQRFGLSFRAAAVACSSLPENVVDSLNAAAFKRGLSLPVLVAMILREMDHTLIDNILDDDGGEAA
jgi:hypothetical protein